VTAERDRIIIKKTVSRKHKTLKERLAGFSGGYDFEEWDTGAAVGRERFGEEDNVNDL
jgi:hypothetical protein